MINEGIVSFAIEYLRIYTHGILDSRHPSPPQDYMPHAKAFGNKCELLVVSNIRSSLYTEYRINDHSIHKVSTAKYLGVIIDYNLSWSDHIGAVSHKANGVLAFLQRNLKKCSGIMIIN